MMKKTTEAFFALMAAILLSFIVTALLVAVVYDDGNGNFSDDFYTDFSIKKSIGIEADE